eukprot:IDg22226t1
MEKTKAEEARQYSEMLMSKIASLKEAAIESQSLAWAFCNKFQRQQAKALSLERQIANIRREISATGSELQDKQVKFATLQPEMFHKLGAVFVQARSAVCLLIHAGEGAFKKGTLMGGGGYAMFKFCKSCRTPL